MTDSSQQDADGDSFELDLRQLRMHGADCEHVQGEPPVQDAGGELVDLDSIQSMMQDADGDNSSHDGEPVEMDSIHEDGGSDVELDYEDTDYSHGTTSAEDESFYLHNLFEPIYENASITLCGAYCAIMEFKRACQLPFSTIAMLLELLQLLCPSNNILPLTVYALKKFFCKASESSCTELLHFCACCGVQLQKEQKTCVKATCRKSEPSTLVNFDINRPIKRILTRTYTHTHPCH